MPMKDGILPLKRKFKPKNIQFKSERLAPSTEYELKGTSKCIYMPGKRIAFLLKRLLKYIS